MPPPSAGGAAGAPAPLTHRQILVVFSGLLLAMLLAALDSTIVATALPTIVGELGGLAHLAWVVTAYLLAQTVVTPLYGKLGDLYGRKVVLQAAIVLFLARLGALRPEPEHDAAHPLPRHPGARRRRADGDHQAVVGDIVPPRERGRYQGIFGAVFGVVERRRAAARRVLHDPLVVALDLLHQPARSASLALVVLAATLRRAPERVRPRARLRRARRSSPRRSARSSSSPTSAGPPSRGRSPVVIGLGRGGASSRSSPSSWWSGARRSRCSRSGSSATARSRSPRWSGSSSASRCSARSPTCPSSCRW